MYCDQFSLFIRIPLEIWLIEHSNSSKFGIPKIQNSKRVVLKRSIFSNRESALDWHWNIWECRICDNFTPQMLCVFSHTPRRQIWPEPIWRSIDNIYSISDSAPVHTSVVFLRISLCNFQFDFKPQKYSESLEWLENTRLLWFVTVNPNGIKRISSVDGTMPIWAIKVCISFEIRFVVCEKSRMQWDDIELT